MNNKTLLIVLLLACTIGAQQFIQLGSNLKLHSLSELHQLETNSLECSPKLAEVSTSMDAWSEILENQDQLDSDSHNLSQLKVALHDFRGDSYNNVEPVLLQFRNSFSDIMSQISAHHLQITPYQRWRKDSAVELQGVVSLLDTAENEKDLEYCCDRIEQLINRLMKEREQVRKQCQNGPQITINIINSKANEVRDITKECSDGQGTIVRIKPKDGDGQVVIPAKPDGQQQGVEEPKKPIQPTQPVRPKPDDRVPEEDDQQEQSVSEPSSTTDEEDDEDSSNKKKPADFTNPDPVNQKETESQEPFTEYGYGYWAKFMLAYPKFLVNGKDAPWYFVSRLSANKKDENTNMGDRLLAIWLGKGYYHFTTCDQPKNQPNVVQNVNYPEDFDGVWTYIYYSYSVEKKKAVAFIKFGNDDLKKITHDVLNPSTKWVRFTIGGKDQNRYPGFNGLIQQIYFSTKPGVFLDSEDDVIGKLQSQKKQPKDFLPELITYKIVSNPQQRDSETKEVLSIVGTTKNPKFPHEYAFSGWFKWEEPKQQQEWHNIFRVQIQQPSTDKFLGDRTLSAWVGKQDGGIIHLPTYTFTNLEGAGNPNVIRNIPHQNRHTEWFFVYFGYSRPQKKAIASIQWKQSTDKQEYENIRHFQVPKFFIYVGKDKQFPGFNGKVALVNFNVGEGSFKPNNDFSGKGDPFNFESGKKKLIGVQPEIDTEEDPEKQKKPYKAVDDADTEGLTRPSSSEEEKPVIEETQEEENELVEYGYGFWMRFLTAYPIRLLNGKNAPWYFVSRLTSNMNYKNIEMGDRLLAIWQGQGYYHFTTCDQPKNQANVIQNINYPNDIEGLWTYVYYSYSSEAKKAIAFIKYADQEPRTILHSVQHPAAKKVKFILGGMDNKQYPGFNGQLSQVTFSARPGVFLDTIEDFSDQLKRTIIPKQDLDQFFNHELISDIVSRKPNDIPDYDEIGGGQEMFPHEYAVSGWFKWEQTQQQVWHNIFRVQIKKPSTDRFLGDRTLSCWIGTAQGGILHFPTYTYTNMNGAGNPNMVSNIQHKNRIFDWFFVYFGYSKNQQKAFVGVRFASGIETLEYNNVNHYYAPKFYTFAGKDMHFPGLNGKLAYVNFNLGDGTFKKSPDFKHPDDIFGLQKGEINILKKPDQKKVQPEVDKETGETQIPNAVSDNTPKVTKEFKSEQPLSEYGYGYWMRFLTAFPVKLPNGKNAPWYFISRLANRPNYDNIAMGDRTLAIWQGQGYYHFTTCNLPGQVNVIKNVNYPADIEGLWTYVYYSYSKQEKKAVAFIQFGSTDPIDVVHQVTHPDNTYVKFILGGKDNNRYPAFNGQFQSVVHSASPGAYIGSIDQFKAFLNKQPNPLASKVPLTTTSLVDSQITRNPGTSGNTQTVEAPFPKEYAFSGWFKWEQPTPQQAWHNLFRVQISQPSTDNSHGDRTLAGWVGSGAGGILHLTTYSYKNMNGAGPNNLPQNINHKNRHFEWFFVYMGYSKNDKAAYAYVKWRDSEDNLEYKDINHYFAKKYFVFVGKDVQFPGFNGRIASTSFNHGEGSFRKGNDFKHPTDAFRFDKGSQLVPKVDPTKPVVDDKTEYGSKFNNNAPNIDKTLTSNDLLVEYGYGFWARFLTAYPARLIYGKNQPWYFVARLTTNVQYDNIRMGDRALAIWQGQGFYHYTTCNKQNGNVNVIQNINYPADIEGVWTYIYYSYSAEKKKAVGFIKYGNDEVKSITHQITHPETRQVRFILGGMDNNRYPAFNGIFTKVSYSHEKGAFIESLDVLRPRLGIAPEIDTPSVNKKIVAGQIERVPSVAHIGETVGDEQTKLPQEYALSGWFRWDKLQGQQIWHNIFRVTINSPFSDRFLGDRTLAIWVGTLSGGILHHTTYTYNNMNGAGNPNVIQNIQHKDRHQEWFFLYYGYSKKDQKAYAYVKFKDSAETLTFQKINHYLAPKFYVYLGKDPNFQGFNGQIGFVNFNIGKGSFKSGNDFTDDTDRFGFSDGSKAIAKPVEPPKPDTIPEADKQVFASASSVDSPKVDKQTVPSDQNLVEYGYGYWLRFLTKYPEQLPNGKNQPWYFVSRLTTNVQYDNVRMGDRALAIWQGQGYYHFTTCDEKSNNANVIKNVDYPADIEGVWTYIYYSYSTKENNAVAFIKFGESDFQQVTHQVTHPAAKQVRFILGGTDEKRYPAFNGLFTNVYFNSRVGAYINSLPNLNKLLDTQGPKPSIKLVDLTTTTLIEKETSRTPKDEPVTTEVEEKKLPHQYAFSGWFRWGAMSQEPWHNIFRVQIKTPSTDSVLGDRTLSAWLGTAEGGIIHLPTYTYTNMNGGGNSNLFKNIQHKGRNTEWHFIYFGYSKDQNKAQVYIKWTQSEDTLEYPDTRHYFASKFYIFTGRDKHFPGFNGNIAQAKFNIGEGSFVADKNFNLPKDPFSFGSGVNTYHKDQPKPQPETKPDSKVLDNSEGQKVPALNKELKDDKELTSYGYGFWMRYLTVYPERQINGKNQPWYFVSRLTWNEKYDNIGMGDRTLAIWQGAGFYHFTTCNIANGNTNLIQNINFPNDIEGLWTYVYYSYNRANKQAVAFIQYGNDAPQTATHSTQHKDTKYVRFILGGNDDGRYPGFNGQFTGVSIDQTYIGTVDEFKAFVTKNGVPQVGLKQLTTVGLADQISRSSEADITKEATVGGGDQKFPQEYAISGWFKWKPTAQAAWHNIFRVQIKKPSTDNFLGDRTLTMWVGTPEGGILHFPTYTYDNMVGGGNTNLYKNIQHKQRHLEWFYVYYGYSRTISKAQVYVKWASTDDSLTYDNVKHYLTPEFYVFVGRDKQYPGLSGKMGYVKFNLGDGSFLKDPNFDHPQDAFGFKSGVENLVKKPAAAIEPGTPITEELSNGFEQKTPVVDKAAPAERDLEEYGYGFWFRFLHNYPVRLPNGKNQPWYFVARLANQEKYDNIRMGDRMLAVWQGQGYYHFTTCNKVDNNPNYIKNINYPEDIEGLWTYLYYSYSDDKNRAVGHIKFGNDDIQSIKHDVNHPETKYVRFILGGNDEARYPGFNGVFSQITFSTKEGAFIDTADLLKGFMSKLSKPSQGFNDLANYKLIEDSLTRTSDDKPLSKVIGKETERFPAEYSFSGWFKWQPLAQQPWHNIFRVQIKTPSTDNVLGDRTLTAWVGTAEGGIIHLPTYTYSNMNGAGNANVWKNIQHKNRITSWFFLYFGYSKDQQLASAYIKWTDGEDQLAYEKTNHYLATQFYVFAGRDDHFPGFNGKLGEVNFNMGKGAFRKPTDYSHEKDIFGFKSGTDKFIKKPSDEFKPADADKNILENAASQDKPVVDKEASSEKPFEQYGYGFWMRFLSKYPEQLPNGKNQPWYFVSRLANQQNYDNVRMGDRTLAIWQGQGYYHFTTCSSATNNPNLIQNNNYPDDIEGLWTYVYYSYSAEQNKAIGFIKYGNTDFQKIVHETTHSLTKYLRFIVGGNDAKRYPGFNGLFTSVTFSTDSAFVSDVDKLNAYLLRNQAPSVVVPLQTTELVKDQISRDKDEKPSAVQSVGSNNKFPLEYALSGWFRWKPTAQAPWHNVFRVQIKKTPVSDSWLGDRTLTCWIGTAEGGILHFPTYTYTNMNGGGNNNFYKNIQYKNRINEWFYVYYGYSKVQATTQINVKWFDSEDSMSYDKINHYLTPEFQVWVGRDEPFVGLNGRIAYVNFNAGDGAYVKNNKFDHPQDIFKFNVGQAKLFEKQEEVKPGQINKDLLSSPTSQDKPVIDQNVKQDNNLEEYGYGFWLRYLTAFPERMLIGKNQPWYFVARLAIQENYDNVRMGDRLLAIWQGQGYYHYTTCNAVNGNANVIQNIDYPADIEGVWTYIYYSYSEAKSRAVGFIKYGTEESIKAIRHDVTHPDTKYVRFILGGTDAKRYPGFNGIFTQVTFDAVKGVFIDTAEQLKGYMNKLENPTVSQVDLQTYRLITNEQFREKTNDPNFNAIGKDNERFPLEYSISGWFKWQQAPQDAWQNIFRVSLNEKPSDQFLGDRTLAAWIGTGEGGIIHMPTYTYANMNGGGNANVWKNIQHKDRHTKWFFIYFGYSKTQAKAYSYIKWQADDDFLNYDNTNHYYAPNFQVFLGRDKFFPGWNGKIAYTQFNLGKGAFKSAKDFTHPNDAFGIGAGIEKLKKPDTGFKPADSDPAVKENAFNQDKPIHDKNANSENPFDEYGYGFWMRFLTAYPQRLNNGKNEAWYFIARLANQEKYDNIRMGDRMLAMWQGQGYYHFTAANVLTGNPNMIQNVNYPEDIEGLWTYVYYSYSVEENKAQGFIKFGEENFKQITHLTTQPLTKYLRFIVGGNDDKRYPGFNGLFTSITFSNQVGAYVDNMDALNKYVNANPYPKLDTTPQNYLLIKDPINRKPENDFFLSELGEEKQRFPVEYSISGWYKWVEGTPANQWQNLYRVLLKKEPTDTAILGDRTLAGWIGFGHIHQSTYTYVNMNGAGNNNIWKQAEHKDRHLRWFFVYHGYSRNDRLSYAFVQYNKGAESLSWDKVNHYFVPRFYIYVGKDAINGFNGQIGAINFNIGVGSFRKGEDFTHDKDFFGFGAPFVQTKVKPFDIKDRTTDLLVSAAPTQEKPSFSKVLPEDEVASAEEYGYGFWARYLTQYPTPQRAGMQGEWTFVSRLTKNQKLQDVTLGDRTLAIFLNRNSAFYFATTNAGNPNAYVNSAVRPDFEGIWIYIHFSHNLEKKSSVALLKYGDEKPFKFQQAVSHVAPSFLQFYLGGKDFYNSWNGQFSDVMVSASKGIFIEDEAALTKHLSGFKMPAQYNYDLKTFEVIPKEQPYDAKQEIKEQIFQEDVALRPEYAWSGWFKWDSIPGGNWFLYARLSIYQGPENLQALGDRTLAAWAGPNVLQFSTYTYTNLVGGGNADSWSRINFGQDLVRWHYIYFGYSLIEKQAFYRVEFKGRLEEFTFKDHKHYYPNRFSLQIGKDKFSQPFVGLASYFRLNVGEGAYRTSGYEKAKNDIFAYNLGKQAYVKPSPTFDVIKDQNKGVFDSPFNGKDPVWTKKLIGSDLDDINEYGYSFWFRHLAHYPVQMAIGLADKPWSFVVRLTKNQILQDITVGDRTLAVWLNQGNSYHFTTYHQGNPNLVQNVVNPNDIDGIWYYLHFAHSLGNKQSIGFLHNGEKLNKVVFAAEHTPPTFLQLYLGGINLHYPALNGQYANVIFSAGDGIFKKDEAEFNALFNEFKQPDTFNRNLVTKNIIDAPKEFGKDSVKDEKVFTEYALVGEYSWTGWFKWTPTVQQAWHLMIRLSILQNSEDFSFLGDRTLSAWVGSGYLTFTCYHVANVNAGGNPNQYQNINYETDYTKWHFIFFGYSRSQRLAHAKVEFKERNGEVLFKNTFQFLPNKFSMYAGRDKFYAPYSGNIAHLRFNGGDGAFDPKSYSDNKQDIFGYNVGKDNVKEKEPEVDPVRQQEVLDSAWNQDKPVYQTEFKKEDLAGIQEYGYGFYFRHLEQYPVQMREGRLEPWYMMSRLSWNKDEGNIRMGDRLLATWQEQAAILFVTNNLPGDPNMLGRIGVAEREGLWTFLYFSYSLEEQLAVGILKFDNNDEVFHIPLKCNHGKIDYLKFTLGSAPPHFYPRFNGQFANYAVKLGPGAFVKNYDAKKKYLVNRIPHPPADDNKFKQFKVVEGEKQFKGDSQDEVLVEVPNDFSKFATEYSISGWLRWDNPALGAPWYNVFRLSLYNGEQNAENRFGDRDLSLFKHNTYYQYHTYNYQPGLPWTFEHVIPHTDQHLVWHFFYSGYSKDKGIQYHYISFQESDVEKVFDKQKHLVVNKHYLSFGKDYKKFFPSHRGFTGIANMVNLNYGEGAFTMKPFTKKNDLFQFGEGEKKYRKPFELLEIWSEKNKLIPSISDSDEIVQNVELTDAKDNIRGLDEYGWVAWVRSSRTEPKNLPFRPHTHSIARLSTQRVNKNTQQPGDRVLVAWQYFPTYYFATYTQGNNDVGQQTPFKIVDGAWRFISMSYKKGQVKAYVYFDEKDVAELIFTVKHELVNDYLRLTCGGETKVFLYNNFNGHLLNIGLRLGQGAHIATKEDLLRFVQGPWKLPDEVLIDQSRKSLSILKEKKEFKSDGEPVFVTVKPETARGKDEYAISGWARWVDPAQIVAWHLLYRVQIFDKDTEGLKNVDRPGDRTLSCWKGLGFFYVATYTVDQGHGGAWNIERTNPYDEVMHKNWVYFYQGYSRQKQSVHIYIKYPSRDIHFDVPANHFVPTQFYVQFGKDQWHGGWNGFLESWYFNTGNGAYKTSDYGTDESDQLSFGLGGRTIPKPKNWESKEMFQNNWGPADQSLGKDVEITDDFINGLTEYGYGMWTRFIWNGEKKLVDKPAWMALSRLTYRPNYQGDAAQIGDRLLAIWVGAGFYHFTTSVPGNANLVNNVNYNNLLDGSWNYIYYGYKKFEKGGSVVGHVFFGGAAVRTTTFPELVNHTPLSDYLYFCVGSSGAKLNKNYHSFNGHISNVVLMLGDGAFFNNADDLRKQLPAMPKFPELEPIKEVIFEEAKDMKREVAQVAPVEFPDKFAGQFEYSVSIWFKWSTIARATWENVYTLSYNEPNIRGNHVRPGDRVLSLFQYADHRQFFSTYTNPDVDDAFQQIYTECPTPALDQTAWVYAYYAYSRKAANVFSFYKTRTTECEKKLPAFHRVPRYFGLYVGKDGIHTPYNGKYQQLYLMAGNGAYRDKDILSFDPYIAGALGVQAKPYKWADKKDEFEQPFDGTLQQEFDPAVVDGHSAYAIGFWSRYLTAIPKRVLDKPAWVSVARFTVNKDYQDQSKVGDRTLALWLGKGFYGFRTYNLATNTPTIAQDIKYDDKLEGEWNFIYFCFASSKQQAIGYVKFSGSGDVKRVTFPEITHKPVEGYGKVIIGKEFSYPGFSGKIAQLQMLFGGQGYVPDVESLEALIKTTFPQPDLNIPDTQVLKIQEDEVEKKVGDNAQVTEWPTQYQESLEYSIFGWFRYASPKLLKDNNVLLRLTNNEPAYRKEAAMVGDRTLLIMYQLNEVVFSTYTLGTIDDGQVANIRKPTPLGNNFGVWTYVWFGYSWPKKVASGIVKFPSDKAVVPYENVLHMVPKYLALFAGSDGLLGGWDGPMRKVGAIFGKGAYIDPNKGNYENMLPNLLGLQAKKSEWKPAKEEIILVPLKDKPGYDLTFKEEVGGVTEYGYGLWTRWLMTTPDRVVEKSPFHQLIRLTNTEKYEDNVALGNRVLAIWAGKGYYHFTTYDKKTNKASISANSNYDDYLEGHWNYIYYSFTAQDSPRAVGFVHFGDLPGQTVARIELIDIAHNPLNGYARVVVANNEFGYPSFNGMITGLRIFFGQGFVGSKEQFLKDVLAVQPKPQLTVPARTDINVLKEEKVVNKGDAGIPIKTQYDQYQGVLEYAVSGWVQTRKGQADELSRMIFRLTINDPTIQKDKSLAGDRTLACFLFKDAFTFSTYDYGDLDSNDDDQNDIQWPSKIGANGGEWIFLYFGYNSKIRKAFAYTLFLNRELGNQYNDLKHFVPNKFWFYLGGDGFNQQFEGTMFNWNLNFGDGAFTNKPKSVISSWPYEPQQQAADQVLSVLLGNQGLSSIKLNRLSGPASGQFDVKGGPASGQFTVSGGPASGVVEKTAGAKSGVVEQTQGPKSGQTDMAPGPKSGQSETAAGPKSGASQ